MTGCGSIRAGCSFNYVQFIKLHINISSNSINIYSNSINKHNIIQYQYKCTGRGRKSAANTGVQRSLALGSNVIITESNYTVGHGV